jgi:hypothetical protein
MAIPPFANSNLMSREDLVLDPMIHARLNNIFIVKI